MEEMEQQEKGKRNNSKKDEEGIQQEYIIMKN